MFDIIDPLLGIIDDSIWQSSRNYLTEPVLSFGAGQHKFLVRTSTKKTTEKNVSKYYIYDILYPFGTKDNYSVNLEKNKRIVSVAYTDSGVNYRGHIKLPQQVDVEKITATFIDGYLRISIPIMSQNKNSEESTAIKIT